MQKAEFPFSSRNTGEGYRVTPMTSFSGGIAWRRVEKAIPGACLYAFSYLPRECFEKRECTLRNQGRPAGYCSQPCAYVTPHPRGGCFKVGFCSYPAKDGMVRTSNGTKSGTGGNVRHSHSPIPRAGFCSCKSLDAHLFRHIEWLVRLGEHGTRHPQHI